LLPLCIHIAQPFFKIFIPADVEELLKNPLPDPVQQLHAGAWLLGPLIVFALGSYSLDSKNWFCFFPGTPYFNRVIQCNIADPVDGSDSRQIDLKTIRNWVMSKSPPETKSSHWWYRELDPEAKAAFNRCANSQIIAKAFRSLFVESKYCLDVVEGMNEVYVTGPARSDEGNNSDQVSEQA
jgi:hypothetical protein